MWNFFFKLSTEILKSNDVVFGAENWLLKKRKRNLNFNPLLWSSNNCDPPQKSKKVSITTHFIPFETKLLRIKKSRQRSWNKRVAVIKIKWRLIEKTNEWNFFSPPVESCGMSLSCETFLSHETVLFTHSALIWACSVPGCTASLPFLYR